VPGNHASTVRKVLSEYADRGVFGGFSEKPGGPGKTAFEFVWLYNRRYSVIFDERTGSLTFKDCLPYFPSDSARYARLKQFIKSRTETTLRAHRRIDEKRAVPSCRNRNACASVSIKVKNNQFTYGTRKLVNLVHEIFLMIDQEFTEYLYEHFDLPEE